MLLMWPVKKIISAIVVFRQNLPEKSGLQYARSCKSRPLALECASVRVVYLVPGLEFCEICRNSKCCIIQTCRLGILESVALASKPAKPVLGVDPSPWPLTLLFLFLALDVYSFFSVKHRRV